MATHYILSTILTCVTTGFLGFFVLMKETRNILYRLFALYCFSIALWSLILVIHATTINKALSVYTGHLLHIPGLFLTIFFIHFVHRFLLEQNRSPKVHRIVLITSYSIGILFIPFILSPGFILGVSPKFGIRNLFIPGGTIYLLYVAFFVSNVIYGLMRLISAYIRSSGETKKQLGLLLLGSIPGYAGGANNFLLVHDIKIYPLYPHGAYLVALYVIITFYAIIKHRLLGIEVIIKKTLVFTGIFVFSYGTLVIFVLLGRRLFEYIFDWNIWASLVPSLFVIIVALRPLERFLTRVTDKYLFQKKYDYKHLIRQFMDELKSMILNTTDVAQSTLNYLDTTIHPVRSSVLMQNKFNNAYECIASIGVEHDGLYLTDDMPLAQRLHDEGQILQIRKNLPVSGPEESQLETWGMDLAIPLVVHKELLGIMLLGKKKSDEDYAEEDLEVLTDLSRALSIALNNAQLFDERADAEKRAMIGTLATGINHEVGNPLNIISIKLEGFRILAQKGHLNKKTKDEVIKEVSEVTDACLDAARRISEITEKISEFAKPDKKLALEACDVNEVINETLSVLKHELALEKIQFETNTNGGLPKILADKGQMQQILFNLLKNAAQACDKPDAKISLKVNMNNPANEMVIKISDNGCGIPKADMRKIFAPFYTTKDPGKGTGLGLALVKRMVEVNHGRIEVDSQEHIGTTFRLTFKEAKSE